MSIYYATMLSVVMPTTLLIWMYLVLVFSPLTRFPRKRLGSLVTQDVIHSTLPLFFKVRHKPS